MKWENEACDLYKKIPREKLDELFENSGCSADMDFTFLGFEDTYQKVLELAPESMTILDLGCAYATQSWYFKDHAKYIGVDIGPYYGAKGGIETYEDKIKCVLRTDKSEFYFESIQKFIKDTLPTLGLDLDNVFAVCSAVPDENARVLVRDTFPNYLDWYPGERTNISVKGKIMEAEIDRYL